MDNKIEIKPIAHIKTDFSTKFGIPRQSGLVSELKASIIFEPEYRKEEAFRGLDEYSHVWLVWLFSESMRDGWSPTVRPPRLGGNRKKGVFATRSPFRPNPIGLSSVELEGMEWDVRYGPTLHIKGADLMDGTPILDIKPYLPHVDSHPEAEGGFSDQVKDYSLTVEFPSKWLSLIPEEKRKALWGVLSHDPRPAYQNDPKRVYGFAFAGYEVKFAVKDGILTVCGVEQLKG